MKASYILFCVFIFSVTTDLNNLLSIANKSAGFLSPVFIGLLIIFLYYSFKYNIKVDKHTKTLLILFGLWFTYGSILNIGRPQGFEHTTDRFRYYLPSILYLFSVSLMFTRFFKEGKFLNLMRIITFALVLNSIVITLTSLGYVISIVNTDRGSDDRIGGLFDSVNQAGVVSSFAQIFCLFFVLIEVKPIRKIMYYTMYFVSLSAAVLTFSKGAFLYSIVIGVGFLYFQTFKADKKAVNSKVTQYLLLICIIIAGAFAFKQMFSNREYSKNQTQRIDQFTRLLGGEVSAETTTNRSKIGGTAISLMENDAFMGRGLGSFHAIPELGGLGTHDTYLLILGEIGVVGLFILLLYYFGLWWASFRLRPNSYSFLCLGIITVLMIASFASHNIFYVKLYIMMFALLNSVNSYIKANGVKNILNQ
ncbi:O-antigen ligase family protein [Mucilaginibacter phyllosphaerae]|uniref:O-antigen ligase domain-containing protein n=1 Tax=Mucilaginibacter phyllosphaerae TaxID=1812349 RepID=A0A4Y8AG57_9SPHI|nr:hypothetical protein [Mucilaginibacter phyllosphaerae]MBB3968629.1 hypothetical protein [Mucilaginibacter phyllosphaerae]TEW67733.1 hypothetical protein E2R65_07025 [Mucilaginibacter phyllosphaerae]GGH14835.1 hypothetical protein GCM10007352_23200 [Mucilaginibacter phyllosphaerae]